ncbi:MAG TPA: carbon starvation CstA family protein [Phycisphaerales bacterium]|nr:carbon starvation CstA family protein [Phycisphaerales bacterium]
MTLALLAVLVIALLCAGYLLYGGLISRRFNLDDRRVTPAVSKNDGIDFVPTRPFYLLGQHFSAIAAAGPIVGPVLAGLAFGWGPCLLWIVIGVIFIGAVHDFAALVASIRHGAHSIAEVAREHLGKRAYLALASFIWLALLYVIVAFTDVTAGTFLGQTEDVDTLRGVSFNPGGAVAMASTLYLAVALVLGVVQKYLKPPMWLVTLVFVPLTLLAIYAGQHFSTALLFPQKFWYVAILVYCFIASMMPLWLLQQPRGYLGGFVLYLAIFVGVVGILFGRFDIAQPAFRPVADYGAFFGLGGAPGTRPPAMTDLLFPFLFVTIACGACSGFHGLVCGGTTSRQISRESHCRPVAFGAMLLEGFVAVIALTTVMIASDAALVDSAGVRKSPSAVYGEGLARFLMVILGPDASLFARTFGTMAVATFVFDTLDVSTRLGRYLLQELTGCRSRAAGLLAAALTAGVPLLILFSAEPASYRLFWTLFGTSNQLLAGLTLLGVAVWLRRAGRKCWYVVLPMIFVMTITSVALCLQIGVGVRDALAGRLFTAGPHAAAGVSGASGAGGLNPTVLNAGFALMLLALAVLFVVEAVRRRHAPSPTGESRT